jgi:hypothetical protein
MHQSAAMGVVEPVGNLPQQVGGDFDRELSARLDRIVQVASFHVLHH